MCHERDLYVTAGLRRQPPPLLSTGRKSVADVEAIFRTRPMNDMFRFVRVIWMDDSKLKQHQLHTLRVPFY